MREHGFCAARIRTARARQYSAEEAARLAGKPARAIRRWILEGRIRAARYGRAYVIDASELPMPRHRQLATASRTSA